MRKEIRRGEAELVLGTIHHLRLQHGVTPHLPRQLRSHALSAVQVVDTNDDSFFLYYITIEKSILRRTIKRKITNVEVVRNN